MDKISQWYFQGVVLCLCVEILERFVFRSVETLEPKKPGQRGYGDNIFFLFWPEWFSIECCKTKTNRITYRLSYSANPKPQ